MPGRSWACFYPCGSSVCIILSHSRPLQSYMDEEQIPEGVSRADDSEAFVYKYRGHGASRDIVAEVKSHHSEEHDVSYKDLTARKIGRGGRRNSVTTVVVVEGGGV